MDQIPSSMATQFIESIVVAGFKKSAFIHEFIHEMSRLMTQRCEDTNSVANVLYRILRIMISSRVICTWG